MQVLSLWKTKKVLLLTLPKIRGGGYLHPLNPLAPLVPPALRTISSMHAVISSTDVVNWGHNFEWPIAKWPSFSSFFSIGVEKSSETLSKIPHTKTRQNRLWSFKIKGIKIIKLILIEEPLIWLFFIFPTAKMQMKTTTHCLYLVLNTQETSHFYWQWPGRFSQKDWLGLASYSP